MPRRQGKRKLTSDLNDESLELNYKLKHRLIKQGHKESLKSKFLPIKTQSGQLMKNNRLDEDNNGAEENEEDEVNQAPDSEGELQMVDEKPKSVVEIIQEKKVLFEKNKVKIANLSHDVIQNPQGEVITIFLSDRTR